MAREMRHSGIEWIGEIPKEWKIRKMKNLCNKITDGSHFSPERQTEGHPYITVSNVYDGKVHIDEALRIKKEDFDLLASNGCKPEKGDVLLSKDGTVGRTAVVTNENFVVLSSLGILSPKSDCESQYIKYLLDSDCLQKQMQLAMAGSALRRITIVKINELIGLLPPISEQQKIANYLDKTCGEVDEMIALQEQMIEELKAYKQSVITEAVAKGLNPDVPMKESGIDWIGEVPEHWEVKKIKHLSNVVRGGSPRPAGDTRYYEGNIPFMKVADITKDEKIYVDSCEYSIKEAGLPHTRTIMPGTLLLTNSGATLGVPKINTFKTTFNDGIAAFLNIDKNLDIIFAYYSLKARTKHFLDSASLGIGQPNLNTEIIGNTPLLQPPLSEQQSIASYLDTKCAEIDALIAIKQAKIDELKDYKKSVIYEYVTGKKEVV